jgi:uncharacterized protein (DUF2141 family)
LLPSWTPPVYSGLRQWAAYVDNNKNGRQDKNFPSVPKEIYGFSNDARGMFGLPDFAEAAFVIGENAVSKPIQLH